MKRKILRHMQKMSRVALLGVLAAAISVGGSLPTAFAATSYETVTETFDWGPSVSKVVVDVDRDVKDSPPDHPHELALREWWFLEMQTP